MTNFDERGAQNDSEAAEAAMADPNNYMNRELSWLQFNKRVMEEALDPKNPLLERVRFLSIFASNLDEFYMVRIPAVHTKVIEEGMSTISGDRAYAEMQIIYAELSKTLKEMEACWMNVLEPALRDEDIKILAYEELNADQREYMRSYFNRIIFPQLTPLAYDSSHPFPYIANQSINLAVLLNDRFFGEVFVRVKMPSNVKRLIPVPTAEEIEKLKKLGDIAAVTGSAGFSFLKEHTSRFIWIEDVVTANLDLVFPGQTIAEAHVFRITRDGDVDLDADGDFNLLKTIEKKSGVNYFGPPIRMEINAGMPQKVLRILMENLKIRTTQVEALDSPVGLVSISEICGADRPDLKYAPFAPVRKAYLDNLRTPEEIFDRIRQRDVLIYRPYDSFESMIDFVRAASIDPKVVSIKITLYRVDRNSKIIEYLKDAADNGKQVAVLIELKARFDEENNVAKAKELEHANVHVIYGVPNLKTHAKIGLVLREENENIVPYVHMSTGNYNAGTAKIYTDFEYFTADPDIGQDAADIFNSLTGYSRINGLRKLLAAPGDMRQSLVSKIRREVNLHRKYGGGHIIFKFNSLVDAECIRELYKASMAGVRIDLQIRGICCLKPGIPGLSENIHVTSIVGRFLEHSRVYYFRNNGNDEMYLGSADLMTRNLDHRVEVLFPVDRHYLEKIRDFILKTHLRDNVKARVGLPDGTYAPPERRPDEEPCDSQAVMTTHQNEWA